MTRVLLCVVSLGLLLLFASAAPGQVCTRYENGRTYILPGCRGPADPGGVIDVDGTIGWPRVHPFLGNWCSSMQILSWNQLMGLVAVDGTLTGPAHPFTGGVSASAMTQSWPQSTPTVLVPLGPDPNDEAPPVGLGPIVEAPLWVRLTASFSKPLPNGSRISRIRITSRDLIEQLKEQLGVSGRRARLVIRRHIEDLNGEGAQLYLVLDGVDYPVEGFLEPLPLSGLEGFYGRASSHRLNRDGAVSSFHFQQVSARALGNLAVDGFTMCLFSLDEGWFKSLPIPQGVGFLGRRFISKAMGGMQVTGLPLDSPMLVTGTLWIGRERVWSP